MTGEGDVMRDDKGWVDVLFLTLASFLGWLYGVAPFAGWGLFGGIVKAVFRPPEPAKFGTYMRVLILGLAGGLVGGLFVPMLLWFEAPDVMRGPLSFFCGFGGAELFQRIDHAWQDPARFVKWLRRRGDNGGSA